MATVTTWTGWEATALRKALRMSVSDFAEYLGAGRRTVAKWSSRGNAVRLRPEMQAALDTVLAQASSDLTQRFEDLRTKFDVRPVATPELGENVIDRWEQDGEMRRRDLISLYAATATTSATVLRLVNVLLSNVSPPAKPGEPVRLANFTRAVVRLKGDYQACRYEQVLKKLVAILPAIGPARATVSREERRRLDARAADLYHLVGSVLLKRGDHALALIAAEHSSRFAGTSDDPIAAGTSARIMTHALLSNGHANSAISLTQSAAQELDLATRLDGNEAVAVYGALLLRGAVAAARVEDRHLAEAMLGEAARAAAKLGHDGNDRWTGFGPTNVMQHRAHIALTFGDAGSAITQARQIPLHKITLLERRASLFVDVAQAYKQWGRHEQALANLRTAHKIAPEEIRTRPAVHQLIGDLAVLSRGHLRTHVADFAATVGVRR